MIAWSRSTWMTKREIYPRALERLVADEGYRARVAAAGHGWAQEHCSASVYATQFVEFLKRIAEESETLDFVDGIADTLSVFLHPGLRDDYVSSISGDVHAITG